MSEVGAKYLETFSGWLQTLGADAEQLSAVLGHENVPRPAREAAAGGINYLFKSLDLIPDGIDDIGYLDDAFVLRVAARMAEATNPGEAAVQSVNRLAGEAQVVEEFLDICYERLEKYVAGLRTGAARGRTVREILDDEATREDFLSDVAGFNSSYEAPGFSRDRKNLIKLRAFLDAKLPK